MKKVLFLAPNYKYIRTTASGLSKDLMRRKIPFTTNVHVYPNAEKYEAGELQHLYFKTDAVEIMFNFDDPVTWSIETLYGVDAVYGKKELVQVMIENFPTRVIAPKGSVQRYIVQNTLDRKTALIVDDLVPAKTQYIPAIKNVYFNDPMTVVIWEDGTKTMVKCQDGDTYSEEVGLAVCISKKALGNKGNFNNVFKKWMPEPKCTVADIFENTTEDPGSIVNAANELLDKVFEDVRKKFRGITK